MLTTLRIKNLALVSDLTLELRSGYNVITGETGAGKSILIGALNLVLGERADRTLLRSGCETCTVEAVFDVAEAKSQFESFLDHHGLEPCEDGQLVLKRTITANGANRQFINGSPATLNALAKLGESLVDIHGPHEHQSLLHPARQLAILDAYGNLEPERVAFGELVRRQSVLEAEKAALVVNEKTYAQQLDLLRYQVNEIESAHLQPDEERQVQEDYQRASNAARLLQLSQAALDLIGESEGSLLTVGGSTGRLLQELQRVDASAARLVERHEQATNALKELQTELSRYAGKVDLDPARLQELETRLNLIQSLRRKYGATLTEVIAFGEEARRKLHSLEARDAELARLNADLAKVAAELDRAGAKLSASRRKVIPRLRKVVSALLADLGFKQSHFEVVISTISCRKVAADSAQGERRAISSSGFDTVEFQFAPNPGEPARPLRAIASSGELARVMLVLKTALAAQDEIPVLIFDEVDANIGGETANAVGEKLREVARHRQVLCITHLPQVAAPAEAHYVVSKRLSEGRTISEIAQLDPTGRVTELARMLGGQSAAARHHAEALLK